MGVRIRTARDRWLIDPMIPEVGSDLSVEDAKQLAIRVAYLGVGAVSPNPLVGAVIVDAEHRFLAAAAHQVCGQNHAEINAIEVLEREGGVERARGGTLYCTLEPCSHHGRTPPCAHRVAELPLQRIVFGLADPHPQAGKGGNVLTEAGKEVFRDQSWAAQCEELTEVYLFNTETQRPFVGMKAATSLDGAIARRGDRKAWLSDERSRAFAHFLRLSYDAVAVGSRTVEADNPLLTIRLDGRPHEVPWRLVIDPSARLITQTKFNLIRNPEKVIWVVDEKHAPNSAPVEVLPLPADESGLAIDKLLDSLYQRGIHSLLLEGGGGLYEPFLRRGLVQRFHMFQTPKILGGRDAIPWCSTEMFVSGGRLTNVSLTPLEQDWLVEGVFV